MAGARIIEGWEDWNQLELKPFTKVLVGALESQVALTPRLLNFELDLLKDLQGVVFANMDPLTAALFPFTSKKYFQRFNSYLKPTFKLIALAVKSGYGWLFHYLLDFSNHFFPTESLDFETSGLALSPLMAPAFTSHFPTFFEYLARNVFANVEAFTDVFEVYSTTARGQLKVAKALSALYLKAKDSDGIKSEYFKREVVYLHLCGLAVRGDWEALFRGIQKFVKEGLLLSKDIAEVIFPFAVAGGHLNIVDKMLARYENAILDQELPIHSALISHSSAVFDRISVKIDWSEFSADTLKYLFIDPLEAVSLGTDGLSGVFFSFTKSLSLRTRPCPKPFFSHVLDKCLGFNDKELSILIKIILRTRFPDLLEGIFAKFGADRVRDLTHQVIRTVGKIDPVSAKYCYERFGSDYTSQVKLSTSAALGDWSLFIESYGQIPINEAARIVLDPAVRYKRFKFLLRVFQEVPKFRESIPEFLNTHYDLDVGAKRWLRYHSLV